MNYDFDNFKNRYGLDSTDKNNDNLSSDLDILDELENGSSLYDELIPADTYSLEDTIRLEKSVLDDISNDTSTTISSNKEELVSEIFDDELEKTLEIDTFDLDGELEELLEPEKKEKTDKKKWWKLPITVANDHHLEHAFVNCAILGFITAAMGSGMLIYIINHINPL